MRNCSPNSLLNHGLRQLPPPWIRRRISRCAVLSLLALGTLAHAAEPTTDPRVAKPQTNPGGTPYCTPAAIDPDEDGFGWENNASCLVRGSKPDYAKQLDGCTIQTTTYRFCDQTSHGWGFEKGQACIGRDYCPSRRQPAAAEAPPAQLSHPKPAPAAAALYQYLRSIWGKRMLAGQMDKSEDDRIDMFARVFEDTGKAPALMGFDFINYTRPGYKSGLDQVQEALAHAKRGGVVSFLWHWRDPSYKTREFYSKGSEVLIPIDSAGRLDRRSPWHKNLERDIDTVAAGLKQLQKAGVAVLWRPLHEASGSWFWWGRRRADGVSAPYAYIQLWQFMHDRLTRHHGLDNLIWVWNGQHAGWYPGDDYVDIVSYDSYEKPGDDSGQPAEFKRYRNFALAPKMLAMSENSNLPDPEKLASQGNLWLWFMTWTDSGAAKRHAKFERNFWSGDFYQSPAHRRAVYNHERVITLDELPGNSTDKNSVRGDTSAPRPLP